MLEADARRLLDAVPTLVSLSTSRAWPALPRAAFTDTAWLISSNAGPPPRFVTRHVATADAPLSVANLQAVHPALDTLCVDRVADGVDIGSIQFPPTLRTLLLGLDDERASTALVRRLGAHGAARLPNLTHVHLRAAAAADITPLVVFADVLRNLVVLEAAALAGDPRRVLVMEAALSRLRGLETATLDGLPTARCFLGGAHTRLRDLSVAAVDTPDAPFARLARACPRLMSVSARWDGPGAPPPGWVGAAGEMQQPPWNRYLQRVSL
jgi:hypothetical protein